MFHAAISFTRDGASVFLQQKFFRRRDVRQKVRTIHRCHHSSDSYQDQMPCRALRIIMQKIARVRNSVHSILADTCLVFAVPQERTVCESCSPARFRYSGPAICALSTKRTIQRTNYAFPLKSATISCVNRSIGISQSPPARNDPVLKISFRESKTCLKPKTIDTCTLATFINAVDQCHEEGSEYTRWRSRARWQRHPRAGICSLANGKCGISLYFLFIPPSWQYKLLWRHGRADGRAHCGTKVLGRTSNIDWMHNSVDDLR